MTKAERVLREIKKRKGMRFGEIQRFIVESNGLNYDEMEPMRCIVDDKYIDNGKRYRRWRGYWCCELLNNWDSGRLGLLHNFCEKGLDGKWRVIKRIAPPWYPKACSRCGGFRTE